MILCILIYLRVERIRNTQLPPLEQHRRKRLSARVDAYLPPALPRLDSRIGGKLVHELSESVLHLSGRLDELGAETVVVAHEDPSAVDDRDSGFGLFIVLPFDCHNDGLLRRSFNGQFLYYNRLRNGYFYRRFLCDRLCFGQCLRLLFAISGTLREKEDLNRRKCRNGSGQQSNTCDLSFRNGEQSEQSRCGKACRHRSARCSIFALPGTFHTLRPFALIVIGGIGRVRTAALGLASARQEIYRKNDQLNAERNAESNHDPNNGIQSPLNNRPLICQIIC